MSRAAMAVFRARAWWRGQPMTEPTRKYLEFYSIPKLGQIPAEPEPGSETRDYRWRMVGENGEPGPPSGEGYTTRRDAYLSALTWLGVAERTDMRVREERDRLALARLLRVLEPYVQESEWAIHLDPEADS